MRYVLASITVGLVDWGVGVKAVAFVEVAWQGFGVVGDNLGYMREARCRSS